MVGKTIVIGFAKLSDRIKNTWNVVKDIEEMSFLSFVPIYTKIRINMKKISNKDE